MSETIEIEWTSEEALFIPNYGMTHKGRRILLPSKIAKSFINSNRAEEVPQPKKLKEVEK